jgi:hypothetical protein
VPQVDHERRQQHHPAGRSCAHERDRRDLRRAREHSGDIMVTSKRRMPAATALRR